MRTQAKWYRIMRVVLGLELFEGFAAWTLGEKLLWLALIFLPFQQALTISVGFPLKGTELLVIAGIVVGYIESRRGYLGNRLSILIIALGVTVVLSTVWALISTPRDVTDDAYPRGLTLDLLMYTAYAGLALAMCLTLMKMLTRAQISSAIGFSVRLAAAYAIIQMIVWSAGSSVLSIVNGKLQTGGLYGPRIPRNGSFLEGNYLGFYAVAAVFICLRSKDLAGAVLAALLVLYSASTTSMIAMIVAMIVVVVLRPSKKKILGAGIIAGIAAILVSVVPPVNRLFIAQLTKLGIIENTLGASYGYSLRNRTVNTETGFSMAAANPLLGVGQGRYAYHYWDFIDLTGLPGHFGKHYVRPIANNVYAQVASETGFLALAVLIAIICVLLVRSRKESDETLALVTAVAVGLVAFPAWTNLVPWVVIAFAAVACKDISVWKVSSRRKIPRA